MKISLLIVWALAFGFALPYVLDIVEILGYQIPHADRASDYLKGMAAAVLLSLTIFLFPIRAVDRKNLLILWSIKCAVALVAMLGYEWKYGLDAFWYFQRSQLPYPDFHDLGLGNGTENLIAFYWTIEHKILKTSSYHAMKIFSSYAGFIGIYLFYRGLYKYNPKIPPKTLLYIGLFPSILFWSTIFGKDPFALLGIGMSFYAVLRYLRTKNPIYFFPLLLSLAYVSLIRSWMAPILVLPFLISAAFNVNNRFLKIISLLLIFAGGLYGLRYLAKSMAMESADALVGQVNQVSKSWQAGGSAGDVPNFDSPGKILLFLPYGMFTALFRPLPGDVLNPFGFLAGLENLFLLYLLWRSIKNRKKGKWKDPMAIWMCIYIFLWSAIYAFISPQNLGSSVRFKLQVLPALLILLTYLSGFMQPEDERKPSEDNTKPSADHLSY